MPFGLNADMAEQTVRILGQNAKLIAYFQDEEGKADETTRKVEEKLGEIDKYLKNGEYNKALDDIDYVWFLNALRSARRSQYGKVRDNLIWLIGQVETLKSIPPGDRDPEAAFTMLQSFRNMYTILINQHIENTTEIVDAIVFQIKRMTTESARIYDLGMRPIVDSDEVQQSLQAQTKREQKMSKQGLSLNPSGLSNLT
jgi:hypothetical protein